MSLLNKLTVLAEQDYTERIEARHLKKDHLHPILSARRLQTRYGPSIMVRIETPDGERVLFLPKRFNENLTDADVQQLNEERAFSLKFVGMKGNSPSIVIIKV